MSSFLTSPGDLSRLQTIDPAAIKSLTDRINASDLPRDRKFAVLLSTGGTVAMKTEGGIRKPALCLTDVLDRVDPHLRGMFYLDGADILNMDSSQMDYRHVRDMVIALTHMWYEIRKPLMGFVILHGTDTMSYSAAALSLMTGQGLPFSVVFTGAQKPITEPASDAPGNIRNALFTLEALYQQDMAEVVICMGDRALLGTAAEKVDDSGINAFDAPRHQYVAHFNNMDYPVRLAPWLKPRRREDYLPTIWNAPCSSTLVVKSMLGLSPAVVARQVSDPDIQAVILYSYGAGTVHDAIAAAILPAASKRGLPVFVVNPVHGSYKIAYESSARAVSGGAIPLDMTLSAALAKIEIAIRLHPGDLARIRQFMTTNYVGEIPTASAREH